MNLIRKRWVSFGTVALFLFSLEGFAGPSTGVPPAYDYPELLVAPRASERVEREAEWERTARYRRFVPVQLPAAAALLTGVIGRDSAERDPDQLTRWLGLGVGGAWLATTLVLSATYHPYGDAQEELASGSFASAKASPRGQLLRERHAEEAIQRAAAVSRKIHWLAAGSLLVVHGVILSKNQMGSAPAISAIGGAALSVAPLLFPSRYQEVAEQQESYRKRIYAPIAQAFVIPEVARANRPAGWSSGVGLSWVF
jgi:hypothetical protein